MDFKFPLSLIQYTPCFLLGITIILTMGAIILLVTGETSKVYVPNLQIFSLFISFLNLKRILYQMLAESKLYENVPRVYWNRAANLGFEDGMSYFG